MPFDKDWVVDAAKELIQIPSRGGKDSTEPIIQKAKQLADSLQLNSQTVGHNQSGLWIKSNTAPTQPKLVLIACIDTAGYDESTWKSSPTSPIERDGWLYGRGSADSKTMAALFLNLAKDIESVDVFLDADEHTGEFGGAHAFAEACPGIAGGYIGYPGIDSINRGCRGFLRVRLVSEGKEAHSGNNRIPNNAVTVAGELIKAITPNYFQKIPAWNEYKPQWTITGIRAGGDWARVPQRCEVDVDIRLTPTWGKTEAMAALKEILEQLEIRQQVVIEEVVSAPAYEIPTDNIFVSELLAQAQAHEGLVSRGARICGPSNVGNFFAKEGIPIVCGFGPRYKNMHAPDEEVCLDDLQVVYDIYAGTLQKLRAKLG